MDVGRANPVGGVGKGRASVAVAATLAVLLLVAAGVSYRVVAAGLKTALTTPTKLPTPLSELPMRIDGWVGEDVDIPEVTKRYMETNFADDYVSRRYSRALDRIHADVYVVYCASRPGGIVGHKPRVCFPAHGWVWDTTSPSEIVAESGRPVKCLIHRFHKPAPSYQEAVVLSFYVLNGTITVDEREFSGFFGRRPNISGDPARYVAQVQISASLEHSVRATAAKMVDVILAFLPDQDGGVDTNGIAYEMDRTAGAVEGEIE